MHVTAYGIGNLQDGEKYKSDEGQVFIIMGRRNGFTLVEMMIVIAIMGVLSAIAIPQWNRYRENADLRTAARNIVADIADIKARATSERLPYAITFNTTGNNYQIKRHTSHTDSTFIDVGDAKDIKSSGSGYSVNMTTASFFGSSSNTLRFDVRGTTNNGSISLQNARSSTANVVINITGKTNVTFNMQ